MDYIYMFDTRGLSHVSYINPNGKIPHRGGYYQTEVEHYIWVHEYITYISSAWATQVDLSFDRHIFSSEMVLVFHH